MTTAFTFRTRNFAALFGAATVLGFPSLSAAVDLVEIYSVKVDRTGVTSVAFSPDGKQIASGGWENVVKLRDARTGKQQLIIDNKGKGDLVLDVAYSSEGSRIATGSRSADSSSRTVTLWNVNNGREATVLRKTGPYMCHDVAFSPVANQLAAGCFDQASGDRSVQVWDVGSGAVLRTIDGINGPVVFSPDGKRVTGGHGYDRYLKVSDTKTGQELLTLRGHDFDSAAYSPDGSRIVSGNEKGILTLWDARTGKELLTLTGHADRVNEVAFSPNSSQIVSGSEDGTLRLWDARTGKQLAFKKEPGAIQSVSFSPDGKNIVSGSRGGALTLLSVKTPAAPVVASAATSATPIFGDTIIHYPLASHGKDKSGKNAITLKGTKFESDALFSDGVNSSARTPQLYDLNLDRFAIQAQFWVSGGMDKTRPVFVLGSLTQSVGYLLDKNGTVSMLHDSNKVLPCKLRYKMDTWHEATITYDASKPIVQLYLDGKLACSLARRLSGREKTIGLSDHSASDTSTFKGWIKDLTVGTGAARTVVKSAPVVRPPPVTKPPTATRPPPVTKSPTTTRPPTATPPRTVTKSPTATRPPPVAKPPTAIRPPQTTAKSPPVVKLPPPVKQPPAVATSTGFTLSGQWTAAYQCPFGTFWTETVKITQQGQQLEAIKLTGDACVPAGFKTFVGSITGNVGQVQCAVGTPAYPAGAWTPGTLRVIDANSFEACAMVFKRDLTAAPAISPPTVLNSGVALATSLKAQCGLMIDFPYGWGLSEEQGSLKIISPDTKVQMLFNVAEPGRNRDAVADTLNGFDKEVPGLIRDTAAFEKVNGLNLVSQDANGFANGIAVEVSALSVKCRNKKRAVFAAVGELMSVQKYQNDIDKMVASIRSAR